MIGLVIELWKIKKVVNIERVSNEKIFGIISKYRITDKGSYVESSTREYDMVSFYNLLSLPPASPSLRKD